jgi:hypothetical protein
MCRHYFIFSVARSSDMDLYCRVFPSILRLIQYPRGSDTVYAGAYTAAARRIGDHPQASVCNADIACNTGGCFNFLGSKSRRHDTQRLSVLSNRLRYKDRWTGVILPIGGPKRTLKNEVSVCQQSGQGSTDCFASNGFAIATKQSALGHQTNFVAAAHGPCQPDGSYRLSGNASAGPGDASDGHSQVSRAPRQSTMGHRARDLFAHCAMSPQQLSGDVQ